MDEKINTEVFFLAEMTVICTCISPSEVMPLKLMLTMNH